MSERRARGYLAKDVNDLLKAVITGEIQVDKSLPTFTVAEIAKLVVEVDQLDPEDKPSTGAITNILQHWERVGYATLERNPLRFVDFTEEGRLKGLEKLEEEYLEVWGDEALQEALRKRDSIRRVVTAEERRQRKIEKGQALLAFEEKPNNVGDWPF